MRSTPRPFFRAGFAAVATALAAGLLAAPAVVNRGATGAVALPAGAPAQPGYWLIGGDGSVYNYGSAGALGSLAGTHLARPVVGMAPTPGGGGYWLVGSDGGIFSFGDAVFYGSTGDVKLNQPIVGMAATPTGKGYWFVAADGGIFSFGDAVFYGSTGDVKLNKPIVGMAPTPTGKGYWFVASDGGIFSFGDATFHGSTGAERGQRITGMAASASGQGYWFVTSGGTIFNFGDAPMLGAADGSKLPARIVVMAAAPPAAPHPGPDSPLLPSTPTSPTGATTTQPTTGTAEPLPAGAFQVALVGDSGYAASQHPIFDRVVAHMNTFPLSFAIHAGDFKDPATSCSDQRFSDARDSFNRSKAPFVYTPGDNEWMDCAMNAGSPMDPVERLGKLREMFFAQDQSLGQTPMALTTQRQRGYPENARWTKEGVVFVTINAPGPSDNLAYGNGSEAGPRRVANQAWLREAFDLARTTNAPAVMVTWQVDPWTPTWRRTWDYLMDWPDDPAVPDSLGPELKQLAQAFGKPVVLVHGDTHVFRVDKGGWQNNNTGAMELAWDDVPNFTRVETWAGGAFSGAQPQVHPEKWILVTVDPKSPQVFSFKTEAAP